MSERTWFYAAQGQQQGPFPETQLRSLIANGTVTPDTLLWTDGMAGWQRAEEIPGLMTSPARPPAMPPSGGADAGDQNQRDDQQRPVGTPHGVDRARRLLGSAGQLQSPVRRIMC